ncbi:MAG TPA: leucyl aminopeptidase [Longimicrobiales bacterium]|nr:leucyl aminopeptidase [Longimicrobiales bacterium]
MQVRYVEAEAAEHPTELLAVAVTQGTASAVGHLESLDGALAGAVGRVLQAGDMQGLRSDEVLLYGGGAGPQRVLLLGVGRAGELTAEIVRRMAARAVRAAERLRTQHLSILLDGLDGVEEERRAQAAAEGAALAAWRFRELKQEEEEATADVRSVDLLGSGVTERLSAGAVAGAIVARAENFARTLQSRPGNVATPAHLAEAAARLAGGAGLQVTVYDEARMHAEGMHAILAVSRGSEEEARLIILEHRGGAEGEPPLVLVGKGLSFDAGGISIKPAAGMESMKFDMSGGAAVMGAMQAIAELGVRANVVGIVPCSENLPSGRALKPGDVIRTLAGKTVEVINTDAEGRLILADALALGARMKPAAMLDCATLTGGVVVALGHHASAVLGNDDALVAEVIAAGEASGERCWRLPMWEEYERQLDSETADLQNIGGREGSTITAACFLAEFVGDVKWAHLDVAGTAYGDGKLPYQRKGGYGVPTRLLVEWVRSRTG